MAKLTRIGSLVCIEDEDGDRLCITRYDGGHVMVYVMPKGADTRDAPAVKVPVTMLSEAILKAIGAC